MAQGRQPAQKRARTPPKRSARRLERIPTRARRRRTRRRGCAEEILAPVAGSTTPTATATSSAPVRDAAGQMGLDEAVRSWPRKERCCSVFSLERTRPDLRLFPSLGRGFSRGGGSENSEAQTVRRATGGGDRLSRRRPHLLFGIPRERLSSPAGSIKTSTAQFSKALREGASASVAPGGPWARPGASGGLLFWARADGLGRP